MNSWKKHVKTTMKLYGGKSLKDTIRFARRTFKKKTGGVKKPIKPHKKTQKKHRKNIT